MCLSLSLFLHDIFNFNLQRKVLIKRLINRGRDTEHQSDARNPFFDISDNAKLRNVTYVDLYAIYKRCLIKTFAALNIYRRTRTQ